MKEVDPIKWYRYNYDMHERLKPKLLKWAVNSFWPGFVSSGNALIPWGYYFAGEDRREVVNVPRDVG